MTSFDVRSALLLYAVTDRAWLGERTLSQVCEEILCNGATMLQLRDKGRTPAQLLEEGRALREITQRYHVPFLINDNVEVALTCGADGVHVGQKDLEAGEARRLIGPDLILGVTANTLDAARAAQAAGADYIGGGAVFGTGTKANAQTVGVKRLWEITGEVDIPVVAIGGINAGNIPELEGSGTSGAAVVSALFGQKDPGGATRQMLQLARRVVTAERREEGWL